MEDYLQQLNDSQRAAVLYNDGPSLVVAGAGSGKTRVLTYKIAHLLKSGYQPHNILALTFTNKAAREMKERIAGLTDDYVIRYLWMGTFHSIFYRILRREAKYINYPSDFTIYDATDSKNLIKSIIKDMKLDDKIYRPGMIQSRISNAKNSLITPTSYASNADIMNYDAHSKTPLIHLIYKQYQNRCVKAEVMDFDDLLLMTNILFRDHADVLAKYQGQFRYVLVDEYQDTNFAQHLIVKRLCENHKRVFVVGDDAQSIYSFRGANIDNMLRFEEQYPNCRLFRLERNYRSTQNIVDAANSLIAKNKEQIPKTVYSEKEKGNKIAVLSSYSDYEEAYLVSSRLMDMMLQKGANYADFAVLYRTNAQSRVLEEAFRKRMLPYRIYGGQSFYQRKEIKDVIAYLRVIINPRDEESLKRIINYPARGIGDTTVGKLQAAANEADVSLWTVISSPTDYLNTLNKGTLTKLGTFRQMIDDFREKAEIMNAADIAEYTVRTSGIYAGLFGDKSVEGVSRLENVQELIKATKQFVSMRIEEGADNVALNDFLQEVSLMTDQDTDSDEQAAKITLMTVHSAKGLEFNNVFIVGMENNLFPSEMSMGNPRAVEEERRLFYVAITRARQNCIITYSLNRFRNGQSNPASPSNFISDIDAKFLTYDDEVALPVERRSAFGRGFEQQTFERRPISNKPSDRRTSVRRLTPVSGAAAAATSSPSSAPTLPVQKLDEFGGFKVGDSVVHKLFGHGEILEFERIDGDVKATIDFRSAGQKKLLMKYAKLIKG